MTTGQGERRTNVRLRRPLGRATLASPALAPIGRDGKPGLKKNYAVGLEISCPGGAYYWAPEIPSSETASRRHVEQM